MSDANGRERSSDESGAVAAAPGDDAPERLGGWAYDVTSEEVRWSPRMFEIHGLPREHRVTLQTILGATHDADADAVARERESWRGAVAPFCARPRIVRADGAVRTVEVCGWLDPFCPDDAPRVIGTARDVTDEVDALEALQAQHRMDVVAAEERTRRRIAAAIHDDAIAALDAAALRLECVQGRALQEDLLRELVGGLREASQRLRLVLGDLMPPVPAGPLTVAVKVYAAALFADVDTRVDVEGDTGALGDELRLVAYRAAQEALRNVRRHADATHVAVEVARRAGALVITVRDDGIGMPTPRASTSVTHGGLRLLAEQVQAVGGVLRVGMVPEGHGTALELELPLDD